MLDRLAVAQRRTSRPTPASAFALGAGAVVAMSLATHGHVHDLLYEVVGGGSVVAIVVGVRRHRPRGRLAWYLLALAMGLWVIGDIGCAWYPTVAGAALPYPSAVDVVYMLGYPALIAAVAMFAGRSAVSRWGWLDGAVIVVASAAVSIHTAHVFSARGPALAVSLAYPVLDAAVLALLVRLLFATGPRGASYRLLVSGVSSVLIADTVFYSVVEVDPSAPLSVVTSALYLASYALIGLSALTPSMVDVSDGRRSGTALTRGRVATLGLAVIAPAAIGIHEVLVGERLSSIAMLSAVAVVISLVMVRLYALVGAEQAHVAELAQLHEERGRLLEEVTRVAEQERVLLAAELHDGPIQRLTALAFRAELAGGLLSRGDGGGPDAIAAVSGGVLDEVVRLRGIVTALRPPALAERGLADALRDHVDSLETRTRIALELEDVLVLGPEQETAVYRIAQEAISNAVRHAGATRIAVTLGLDNGGSVQLRVLDDGRGFDASAPSPPGHYGLLAMRERALMFGGTLDVRSSPSGTVVTATIPVDPAAPSAARQPADHVIAHPRLERERRDVLA
jgi:signal transduction histidine kinase